MGQVIGIVALLALLGWFLGFGRARPLPAPEDDLVTPVDHNELAEAEREVMSEGVRPIHEALKQEVQDGEEEEDWGPGTSRSNLPGIG